MKAKKTYAEALRDQAPIKPPPVEQLTDVLFRSNTIDKIVTCNGCETKNRVSANRGAASCAGCGFPLGVGTPAKPSVSMFNWQPEPGAPPFFGTDRTIRPEDLARPPQPRRSLWTRIADAWRAAWAAWKWGPG